MSAAKVVVKTCPFCGAVPAMEHWHGGGPLGIQSYLLGFQITSNVPVGPQGSMDSQIRQFAVAMKTHIPVSQ